MARMNWNPYQTFVWTKSQIDKWADDFGPTAFYDGEMWSIECKKITPGRYRVWFVKYAATQRAEEQR
jgi:hypothetical protein